MGQEEDTLLAAVPGPPALRLPLLSGWAGRPAQRTPAPSLLVLV